VTELIYIHSKLIIVDDREALIGSANINDRSQVGKRDSEVALFVRDTEFTPSRLAGAAYESGVFAGSLRRYLFQEHLGLLPRQLNSPSRGPQFDSSDHASSSPNTRRRQTAAANPDTLKVHPLRRIRVRTLKCRTLRQSRSM
jgi:phosphatidylserine/phosphatidylglycerophosphate/cardiolipin synthase-like enzyme